VRDQLFGNGYHSAAHVGLGYIGASCPQLLFPFLLYQVVHHAADGGNEFVCIAEYLAGWLARSLVDGVPVSNAGQQQLNAVRLSAAANDGGQ
jgi:hypothetical protein